MDELFDSDFSQQRCSRVAGCEERNTNFFMTKHLNEVLPMRFHGPFKGMKMCGTQLYDE